MNTRPLTTGYADVCIGNTPFTGTVYGIDINQRATLRTFKQSVFTNTLAGDHKFGDGWGLKWAANYTESIDDRSVVMETRYESPATRNLRPTVSYDFTDPFRQNISIFSTVQNAGPTSFQAGPAVTVIDSFTKPLTQARSINAVDVTSAWTGKAELSRQTALFGGEGIVRLGFQYDTRTKESNESELVLNNAQVTGLGVPTDYASASLDVPFRGKLPLAYTFRYFSEAFSRNLLARAISSGFGYTPIPANFYNVREEVFAGYLMANSKFDWGSIVGGVRAEHVKNSGRANGTIAGVTRPISASSSSTLFFPSLHANIDVADDKKLRIGFTSGAARADYDQLRPNVTVNDTNGTISGGNPSVKPERAYGVDAYLEWYVQPQGYFMLGAFYKRVEDVLYNQRRTFGSNALDVGGTDRSGYIFTGITNGGGGRVFGLEAAAQLQLEPYTEKLGLPDWMGGFGISANVTLNDSQVTKPVVLTAAGAVSVPVRNVRLPGTSDVVYNLGAYYEKYGLSIRFQYQKRTTWLDGIADDLTDAGDVYWDADDELDFSARYEILKGVEVFFDATNLLDKPGRRYSDPANLLRATGVTSIGSLSDKRRTIEFEKFGRRYSGGVRVTF